MEAKENVRGRFAPSPSGRMHLGNVCAALLSWLSVRSQQGDWLLRIEDLDPRRSRREYAEWIQSDLQWLGLDWDEEPVWQSERTSIYEAKLDQLQRQNLIYPCFCSPSGSAQCECAAWNRWRAALQRTLPEFK